MPGATTTLGAVRPGTTIAVIAHRGSSGTAPENTAPAIEDAIRHGADFVEVDVQRSRDGVLVNFHDCTLTRTTDAERRFPGRPSYRISDFTLPELKLLDAGSWFSDRFAGEPILTLDEVITLVRGRVGLLVETSPCANHADTGLPEQVADELAGRPGFVDEALAAGRLIMQSFRPADARAFRSRLPAVPVAVLTSARPDAAEVAELGGWADQLNPDSAVTDAELIDLAHRAGLAINVWVVNDPGRMRELIGLGADGIITDHPRLLTRP